MISTLRGEVDEGRRLGIKELGSSNVRGDVPGEPEPELTLIRLD